MRGTQRGVFKAGEVCVDFCSRREDTFFPGFSYLHKSVSACPGSLAVLAFSCVFSCITSVCAESLIAGIPLECVWRIAGMGV